MTARGVYSIKILVYISLTQQKNCSCEEKKTPTVGLLDFLLHDHVHGEN